MCKKKNIDDMVEMPRVCAYCEHSCNLFDSEKMLCKFKGVVAQEYKCRKFKYDPLKRSPYPPHIKLIDLDDDL